MLELFVLSQMADKAAVVGSIYFNNTMLYRITTRTIEMINEVVLFGAFLFTLSTIFISLAKCGEIIKFPLKLSSDRCPCLASEHLEKVNGFVLMHIK